MRKPTGNRIFKIIGCFLCLFFSYSHAVKSQTIKASFFGFDGKDATDCLMKAIFSENDTIIIDKRDADWRVRPLIINGLTSKTIVIEKGVILKALEGTFSKKNDCLLKLINCSDISIEGNGAVFKMNKEEYIDGEWRHILSIRKSRNLTIRSLVLRDSGGDGIYISGTSPGSFSENITIEDIKSSNNKRQGISIISAQNVWIRNSLFSRTNGTLPECGVDIEPNEANDRVVNIHFENCSFTLNNSAGIKIEVHKLKKESLPISVTFKDCYLNRNVQNPKKVPAEILIGAHKESPVTGTVNFINCLVEDSDYGLLYSRKRSDAFTVDFINCAAINICKKGEMSVIGFEVPDYKKITSSIGSFNFGNLYVKYHTNVPVLKVRGSRLGTLKSLKNVKGTISVKNNLISQIVEYINYDPSANMDTDLKYYVED